MNIIKVTTRAQREAPQPMKVSLDRTSSSSGLHWDRRPKVNQSVHQRRWLLLVLICYLWFQVIHENSEVGGVVAEAGGHSRASKGQPAAVAGPAAAVIFPGRRSQHSLIHQQGNIRKYRNVSSRSVCDSRCAEIPEDTNGTVAPRVLDLRRQRELLLSTSTSSTLTLQL